MAHILLVDDEQNILNALRRELEGEHDVEAFTSALEALQRAKTTEFDLVMTDYLMPGMDGVSFLERFAQSQPDAVRLILSGQADVDALIKAINVSHPYLFVSKPWSQFDLQASITQALNYHEAMLENRRLAATYHKQHGTFPPAQAHRIYRILLASDDAIDAALIKRELTSPAAGEERNATSFYGMHGCFLCKDENFQSVVDCLATRQQVLEHLENEVYDLLIVDLHMLDNGKPVFLNEIRVRSQESALMLIGDTVNMDTIAGAINQIQVDDFIKRPWNACELKGMVLRALHYRDLRQENCRLADLFRQQENLN